MLSYQALALNCSLRRRLMLSYQVSRLNCWCLCLFPCRPARRQEAIIMPVVGSLAVASLAVAGNQVAVVRLGSRAVGNRAAAGAGLVSAVPADRAGVPPVIRAQHRQRVVAGAGLALAGRMDRVAVSLARNRRQQQAAQRGSRVWAVQGSPAPALPAEAELAARAMQGLLGAGAAVAAQQHEPLRPVRLELPERLWSAATGVGAVLALAVRAAANSERHHGRRNRQWQQQRVGVV
jgi:hypothetical protein